jgi:DNA-binding LacI/PurR family transcriptional regulator
VPLVPHVYVNRRGPDPGHDVVMDEAEAVRLYIDHASELGHRSVALIDGPAEVDTVYRRVSAARRICAARRVRLTVRHAAPTEEGGWDATMRTPLAELGSAAVDALIARIDRAPAADVMVRAPMRLILRGSVAEPRAAAATGLAIR